MLRRMVGVAIFSALMISLSPGANAPSAPANLTAAQVVEKNVAARGGLQAWRAIQALSMSGKLEAGGNERSARPIAAPALRSLRSRGRNMIRLLHIGWSVVHSRV